MKNIIYISIISIFSSCSALQPRVSDFRSLENEDTVDNRETNTTMLSFEDVNKLSISQNIMGDYIIKDNKENRKTISKDIIGDYTIKDDRGNRTTISKDIMGDYTIKDKKGNRKTISKDIMGDYTIKDDRGNRTTISKDIMGDYTIERIIMIMRLSK